MSGAVFSPRIRRYVSNSTELISLLIPSSPPDPGDAVSRLFAHRLTPCGCTTSTASAELGAVLTFVPEAVGDADQLLERDARSTEPGAPGSQAHPVLILQRNFLRVRTHVCSSATQIIIVIPVGVHAYAALNTVFHTQPSTGTQLQHLADHNTAHHHVYAATDLDGWSTHGHVDDTTVCVACNHEHPTRAFETCTTVLVERHPKTADERRLGRLRSISIASIYCRRIRDTLEDDILPTTKLCDLCFLYFYTNRGAYRFRWYDSILGGCEYLGIFRYEIHVNRSPEDRLEHDKGPGLRRYEVAFFAVRAVDA